MLVDSPAEFAAKRYDFVIVGGGTAGLTLAARLTEDPKITVGVIEAGQNRLADPNILIPGCKMPEIHRVFGLTTTVDFNALGHPDYDWAFKTTAQVGFNSSISTKIANTYVEVYEWPCRFATTWKSVGRI